MDSDDCAPTLWTDDGAWTEQDIPRRPWIAPRYLLRGAVTVVGGPGSGGKSSLMLGWAAALALGVRFGNFGSVGVLKTLLFNVEDDGAEQRRRLSATLRQFGRLPTDLAGRVCRAGPHTIGLLVLRNALGKLAPTPLGDELIQHIEMTRPDVLMVDPLAELHGCEENDNVAIRGVIAWFRDIAVRYNLAVVVLHHTRKGSAGGAGDPDTLRGASAIIGAARVVLTVSGMTEDEAKALGVPPEHRKHFFRLDGAKSNYAPPTKAEWFERVEYELDNGEAVAAPVPWTPPEDVVSLETLLAIETGVASGFDGVPWAARGGGERDVKNLFAEHGVSTAAGAAKVKQHFKHVGIELAPFRGADRHKAQGYRTRGREPKNAAWTDHED